MTHMETLIEEHFHKKPGENLEALKDRYEQIRTFHRDPLSAALLATSYYGMEELQMRLPRLNDMLRNPFAKEEVLHAITGLIMVADGGPAEGAKAIQIQMFLQANGIALEEVKSFHLLSLLSICCRQARAVAEAVIGADEKAFQENGKAYLKAEQERLQALAEVDETSRAYALLVGMAEELETVLAE